MNNVEFKKAVGTCEDIFQHLRDHLNNLGIPSQTIDMLVDKYQEQAVDVFTSFQKDVSKLLSSHSSKTGDSNTLHNEHEDDDDPTLPASHEENDTLVNSVGADTHTLDSSPKSSADTTLLCNANGPAPRPLVASFDESTMLPTFAVDSVPNTNSESTVRCLQETASDTIPETVRCPVTQRVRRSTPDRPFPSEPLTSSATETLAIAADQTVSSPFAGLEDTLGVRYLPSTPSSSDSREYHADSQSCDEGSVCSQSESCVYGSDDGILPLASAYDTEDYDSDGSLVLELAEVDGSNTLPSSYSQCLSVLELPVGDAEMYGCTTMDDPPSSRRSRARSVSHLQNTSVAAARKRAPPSVPLPSIPIQQSTHANEVKNGPSQAGRPLPPSLPLPTTPDRSFGSPRPETPPSGGGKVTFQLPHSQSTTPRRPAVPPRVSLVLTPRKKGTGVSTKLPRFPMPNS